MSSLSRSREQFESAKSKIARMRAYRNRLQIEINSLEQTLEQLLDKIDETIDVYDQLQTRLKKTRDDLKRIK